MSVDPVELRGVGIQITKLEGETKVGEREAGQGMLPFAVQKGSTAVSAEVEHNESSRVLLVLPSADGENDNDPPVVGSNNIGPPVSAESLSSQSTTPDTLTDRPEPESPTPKIKSLTQKPVLPQVSPSKRSASGGNVFEQIDAGPSRLPASSEGIDPDFLAALPPELRREVKRDHARTRNTSEVPPLSAVRPANGPRAATVSPAKPKGMHATAHITRQLRPKLKTQLNASALANLPLYGAWAKADERVNPLERCEQIDEKEVELRELDLDPDVFRELPAEMQKEVLDEERRRHRQRKILHRPADGSHFNSKARESTRTASLSPARSSRAGSVAPHALQRIAIARPSKPALLKATALTNVLETVSRWIESRGASAPAARDAGKVKTYLIKCMAPEAGMGGPENASEVLKWMRSILLESWKEDGQEVREPGVEWWAIWRDLRKEVDQISLRRFGAPIKL